MISVLIVDDEKLARERIKHMLSGVSELVRIIECQNGQQAYKKIQDNKIDIIFLDIQMPEMTGIEFIETVGLANLPLVIFVTAYDEYAVKAFEFHAVDYLLKPFDKNRFSEAFERAKQRLELNKRIQNQHVKDLLKTENLHKEKRDFLFVKESGLIKKIAISKIHYVESSGNYLLIHLIKEKVIYRETLKNMIEILPGYFRRVHKSFIVNTKKISQLQSTNSGDYKIVLLNDKEISLSRRYKSSLSEFF